MATDLTFPARLMPAPRAAAYLGISETKLLTLKLPRRMLDGKRFYDRLMLDDYADSLTLEGQEPAEEVNTYRGKFGRQLSWR